MFTKSLCPDFSPIDLNLNSKLVERSDDEAPASVSTVSKAITSSTRMDQIVRQFGLENLASSSTQLFLALYLASLYIEMNKRKGYT